MADTEKEITGGGKKKRSASTVIAVVAVILVLVLGAVLVYVLMRKDPEPEDDVQGKATIVTDDNAEDVIRAQQEGISDASYTATMTNEWVFEDGKAAAENFYVENTENNSRTVYFDLQLKDTGETIYSSPYIPVGESMDTITLDKKLDKGDYDVIMVYHLVDDAKKELTTVSVAVEIHILN